MNVSFQTADQSVVYSYYGRPKPQAQSKPLPADSPARDEGAVEPAFTVEISNRGQAVSQAQQSAKDGSKNSSEESGGRPPTTATAKGKNGTELTKEEQQKVAELREADRKVKAHEMAHMAAGGNVVKGGASYEYEKGPDGVSYAIAGEVPIDTSEGKTPQETIIKMTQVQAAAMAPADPSSQDRKVAADAAAKAAAAQMEATAKNFSGTTGAQPLDSSSKQPQSTNTQKAGPGPNQDFTGLLLNLSA